MEWTQDQIAAVVGSQQLEIIGRRLELTKAEARIKELMPKSDKEPDLKVVPEA